MKYVNKCIVKQPEGYLIKNLVNREAILADYPELKIDISYAGDCVYLLFADQEAVKDIEGDQAEFFIIDTSKLTEGEIRNLIEEYKKYLNNDPSSEFYKME